MRSITLLFIVFQSIIGFSQEKTENRNLENKIAINGYDPVSYFTNTKPLKGKKEYAVSIKGAIYYCNSLENKKILMANPAKYEPQYGGWCAYAMGKTGEKVEIDPETFKIIDGKIYLFYNKFLTNTLKLWNKEEEVLRKNAEKNWKSKYHK